MDFVRNNQWLASERLWGERLVHNHPAGACDLRHAQMVRVCKAIRPYIISKRVIDHEKVVNTILLT